MEAVLPNFVRIHLVFYRGQFYNDPKFKYIISGCGKRDLPHLDATKSMKIARYRHFDTVIQICFNEDDNYIQ